MGCRDGGPLFPVTTRTQTLRHQQTLPHDMYSGWHGTLPLSLTIFRSKNAWLDLSKTLFTRRSCLSVLTTLFTRRSCSSVLTWWYLQSTCGSTFTACGTLTYWTVPRRALSQKIRLVFLILLVYYLGPLTYGRKLSKGTLSVPEVLRANYSTVRLCTAVWDSCRGPN